MTTQQAQALARRLGLSAWIAEAIAVGQTSHTVEILCVGFASAEFPIAHGESWEQVLAEATRIIFSA